MKRISKKAIKYWRIKSSLYLVIPIILLLGLIILKFFIPDKLNFIIYIGMAVVGIFTLIFILYNLIIKPLLMYKYFRYQITEETLVVESGIFTRTRNVAPLFRIQNIDVTEGPLMRKFGLMGISLSNSSDVIYIPELEKRDAVLLRKDIRRIIDSSRRGENL